jgi:hypothetical protein
MVKKLVALASLVACFSATPTIAAQIKVKSWCPMTHASGIGTGPTFEVARDAAVKACLANGGQPQCCPKFYRKI